MRYEVMIVSDAERVPSPDALLNDVRARGLFQVERIAQGGYDDPADSPRLVVAESGGARVLLGFERGEAAQASGASLLAAPPPLTARLSEDDRALLERARLTCHLRVSEPGGELGSALRFMVQLVDALVEQMPGVVVDPQMMSLFGAQRWREARALGEAELRRHVCLHAEEGSAGLTVRTYGMVKFDRPELCVEEVPEALATQAALLLDRVARQLASGAELRTGDLMRLDSDCILVASAVEMQPGAPPDEALLRLCDEGETNAARALAAMTALLPPA